MSTTIHLPSGLLESVDRRAKEMGLSRNRYIRLALENAVAQSERWSPGFLKALDEASEDIENHRVVDEMLEAIETGRTRKAPPDLQSSP